jgi:hypothetical protein
MNVDWKCLETIDHSHRSCKANQFPQERKAIVTKIFLKEDKNTTQGRRRPPSKKK